MAHSSGKCVAVSAKKSETAGDVLRKFTQHTEREGEHRIIFRGQLLENHKPLTDYGIESGDLHLLPLGNESGIAAGTPELWPLDSRVPYHCLAAVTANAVTNNHGVVDAIRVISGDKPSYPDITFKTIRLSCESHVFRAKESRYAGFILYAWTDDEGGVRDEWWLNGKHCKSAYLVIQDTESPDVKRYVGRAPGQVHGAVYWNVFGEGADVKRAVGEGFAFVDGKCKWNSYTFNANDDAYHDGKRGISDLAKKCLNKIINDWRQTSHIGKTYNVEDLLSN